MYYYDKLKLAKYYEKGIGVKIDIIEAKSIYEELFNIHHTQEAFDWLYSYYNIQGKINAKKTLLEIGLKFNLKINSIRKSEFEDLIFPYATNNYKKICTKNLKFIDTESNVIYYIFDYYKKWWKDNFPNEKIYLDNYNTFIDNMNAIN